MRRRLTPVLVLCAFVGCDDDSTAPTDPPATGDLSVTPATQWSGGAIIVSSEAVAEGAFAIVLEGDTLDATPKADGTVEAVLPNPRLTGPAVVELHVDGAVVADAQILVLGAARAPLHVECDRPWQPSPCIPRLESSVLSYHGVGLPDGRLLAYVQLPTEAGYGVTRLNDPIPAFEMLSGLERDPLERFPGLLAPGPSMEPGSWLLEASAEDTAEPPVRWPLSAARGGPEPLTCVGIGVQGGYVISETASGDCLVLTHAPFSGVAQLTVGGTEPVPGYQELPPQWGAGCVGFRSAPRGEWTTLRSLQGFFFCEASDDQRPAAWPVFGPDGGLAFTSDRYPRWPKDAEFTSDGLLWVIGEKDGGQWSLDAWDPAVGDLLAEAVIEGVEACWGLRADLMSSRLFVACRFSNIPSGADDDWPSLVVYDRAADAIEAVLHTPEQEANFPVLPPFELIHGVAAGMVHLTAVWDGTTAPIERGLQVASWDVR